MMEGIAFRRETASGHDATAIHLKRVLYNHFILLGAGQSLHIALCASNLPFQSNRTTLHKCSFFFFLRPTLTMRGTRAEQR